MKRALLIPLLACLLSLNMPAQVPAEASASRVQQQDAVEQQKASPEIDAKLRRAAEIHEYILTALAQHEYEAVFPEFQEILALGMEGEQEGTLVDAVWVIVRELRQDSQFALAHQIIDATLDKASATANRWRLVMLKAQTYRDAGDIGRTRQMLLEARKLEP